MRRALTGLLLLALAAPATAVAGGYATVGLAPPPAEVGPGDTWNAELTVLQHGVTPMRGQEMSVVISRPGGSDLDMFFAKETADPGVYRAEVVFPGGGEWRYLVTDPFGVDHEFPPLELEGATASAPTDTGSGVWPAIAVALAALLLLAAFGAFALRGSMKPASG